MTPPVTCHFKDLQTDTMSNKYHKLHLSFYSFCMQKFQLPTFVCTISTDKYCIMHDHLQLMLALMPPNGFGSFCMHNCIMTKEAIVKR